MKLLMVTPYYYPHLGGVEGYARQLGIALREFHDWEIVVVTANCGSRTGVIDRVDDMLVYRLGIWAKISNTPFNPTWPTKIRAIIRKERPDLILGHTPVPFMADSAALAAGRTPFLLAYHAATLLKADSPGFNALAHIYGILERITFSRSARVLAVSDYVHRQLPEKVRHKATVLPNAVSREDIRPRSQPTHVNFLFIGSLDRTHAWKGLDMVLEAMSYYREASGIAPELTILGDGNHRDHYESLTASLKLRGTVHFHGWQIGEAKEAAFDRATALIIYPITENDALPTVMLEAWARGVPVVAARIGALPTLITDEHDGFLVQAHDPAALAMALRRIADMSQEDRGWVAAAAAQRVTESFTWERQADDLVHAVCHQDVPKILPHEQTADIPMTSAMH